MASNLFIWSFSRAASSGDTLTFYDEGTTTPKNVYAETALTTNLGYQLNGANAADANGKFRQVYLQNSAYTVIWYSSTGTEKGRIDTYSRLTNFSSTGDLDMNGRSVTDLPAPTLSTDAVRKSYVDALGSVSGTFTVNGGDLNYYNTNTGGVAAQKFAIKTFDNSVNNAYIGMDGDAGLSGFNFNAYNSSAKIIRGAYLLGGLSTNTAGAEEGFLRIGIQDSGAGVSEKARITADGLSLFTTDIRYKATSGGSFFSQYFQCLASATTRNSYVGISGGTSSAAVNFNAENDAAINIRYVAIDTVLTAGTDGAETGELRFATKPSTGGVLNRAVIYDNGSLYLGDYNTVSRLSYHQIKTITTAAEGDTIAVLSGSTSTASTAAFYAVSATGANAAATALLVQKNNATGRSINAAGTVNAAGADYAEWRLVEDGEELPSAGEVVGISYNGKVTKDFSKAHTFKIVSTDPSFVGGDKFHASQPERCVQLAFCGIVPLKTDKQASVGDYVVVRNGKVSFVTVPLFPDYIASIGKVWAIDEGVPQIEVFGK